VERDIGHVCDDQWHEDSKFTEGDWLDERAVTSQMDYDCVGDDDREDQPSGTG
jgi:hypothetical protein